MNDHAIGENINVSFAALPIGSVHGKDPSFGRLGELGKNEHPNFGRPSARQAFSWIISLIFSELGRFFVVYCDDN